MNHRYIMFIFDIDATGDLPTAREIRILSVNNADNRHVVIRKAQK